MGACGSANAASQADGFRQAQHVDAAKRGAGREVPSLDEQEVAKADSMLWGSEMDFSQKPNSEKKTLKFGTAGSRCVGVTCRKGRKPSAKLPNQDSWCVHRLPGKTSAYAVFDGHGAKGHLISDYVKQSLTKSIVKQTSGCSSTSDLTLKVQACFRSAQRMLESKPHLGAQQSGTTATVVVHDHENEKLCICHVGDSTAVLLKAVGPGEELVAEVLTRDHKPELEDERERIEKQGRIVYDGYCHRVVRKSGTGPGLNMSRSLGDVAGHRLCGISACPEVREVQLAPEDRALLLCSDGIWEVISPREAAQMVSEYGPMQASEAAKRLADEALRRWLEGTDGQMTDDITVVLACIPAGTPSPSLSRTDTASTETPSMASITEEAPERVDTNAFNWRGAPLDSMH